MSEEEYIESLLPSFVDVDVYTKYDESVAKYIVRISIRDDTTDEKYGFETSLRREASRGERYTAMKRRELIHELNNVILQWCDNSTPERFK